ncbi:pancreatic lipase-related protein 2-like [Glandiceps talaboti]
MKCVFLAFAVIFCLTKQGLADEVCYGDLGCFNNDPPYDNSPFLPQDPADVATGFWLYTEHNMVNYQVIDRNDPASLENSNFDKNKDTKFLIHGWTSSGTTGWVNTMRDEFLNSEEKLNVIAVDWNGGAAALYGRSVANTQIVGAEVDAFIRFLDTQLGDYPPSMVHLIGHSLGAHCSGHAGKRSPDIGRISGLDPAGPSFENEDPLVRLDETDAVFVDILHTDTDGSGIKMLSGDADFYPNGGVNQAGCPDNSCDHGRPHEFYSESINSLCKFIAYPCELDQWDIGTCPTTCDTVACSRMGYHALPEEKGTFYLETYGESPFCME